MPQSLITSGETALATTSADPVNAIVMPVNGFFRNMKEVYVVNEGVNPGFISIDGVTWIRIPAQDRIQLRGMRVTSTVRIKREGSNDMTGVFISIW